MLEAVVFRSALMFAMSLIILTTYTVIFERMNRGAPSLWTGIALVMVMLVFRVSAIILTAATFTLVVPSTARAGSTNEYIWRFVVAIVGFCGLWAAAILLQILCNLVRQFIGSPMKRVNLWRTKRRPRTKRMKGSRV